MSDIVTRFAPSPTGYLHIGGARTALFNWLLARSSQNEGKGKFLLRIEDTDRARHNEEAVTAILQGLDWLGLDWDGDPISQFARVDRHAEVAQELLSSGHAYRCWLEGEELEKEKAAAREEGRRFESPWRDQTDNFPDKPFVVRLKAPQTGKLILQDQVQGDVPFDSKNLDDMVLLRSDGTPTYMLAVVVDDHDMGVTHIVRGDDHLINGARQKLIYEAMNWNTPIFAHIPLIHGQDGAKLSKRHGALGVESYRDLGYLPEALTNYLLRLGWSHGDEEIIPIERAKEVFSLSAVNKAASRLDIDKLDFVNSHYLKELDDEAFMKAVTPFFEASEISLNDMLLAQIQRAIPFLKNRSKNFVQVVDAAKFITATRPFKLEGKAAKPLKKEGAAETLQEISALTEKLEEWTAEAIDNAIKSYVETKGVGFGMVGQPVRAALSAGFPSPSLGEIMYCLGKDESLARLSDQFG